MQDLKLSADGLYYWDGARWVSTLSPDGRWRWNGSAWVPLTGMVAPPVPYYPQPPPAQRVPTAWTKPMQYAVAAWYGISGLYALSLPFWMSGIMAQSMTQAFQQQAAQNPDVSPPPPDVIASFTSMATGVMWVAALIGLAIAAVVVIGALLRWTWLFYVVLVLLGLSTLSLPVNVASALFGSSALSQYGFPSSFYWISVVIGIPAAALFVWMLIGAIRFGPWAMAKKVDAPVAPAPAS